MIAVPIGPQLRMAVAGFARYFAKHPIRPKTPHDLTAHNCINMRMQLRAACTSGTSSVAAKAVNVRVDGQLIFNTVAAAWWMRQWRGWVSLPCLKKSSRPTWTRGALVRVLEDWCPPFDGYHLYYPSRRQPSPAFSLVLKALIELSVIGDITIAPLESSKQR
jgi:DNA-binding transcriptional LysR family regulator